MTNKPIAIVVLICTAAAIFAADNPVPAPQSQPTATGQAMPSATPPHNPTSASAPATSQPTSMPASRYWGPEKDGLQTSITIDGECIVGGRLTITIRARNVTSAPFILPPPEKVSTWVFVSQRINDQNKVLYTERILAGAYAASWPAEIKPGQTFVMGTLDISKAAVLLYGPNQKKSTSAPATKPTAAPGAATPTATPPAEKDNMPVEQSIMAQSLTTGLASIGMLLNINVADDRAVTLESNVRLALLTPSDLRALDVPSRKEFLATLMSYIDRDETSAKLAYLTIERFGQLMAPELIAAALDKTHPAFARSWMAAAMCDIPDPRVIDPLVQMLDDPDDRVRRTIAYNGPKQNDSRLNEAIASRVAAGRDEKLAAAGLLGFLVFNGTLPKSLDKVELDIKNIAKLAYGNVMPAGASLEHDLAQLSKLKKSIDERIRQAANNAVESAQPPTGNWTEDGKYTIQLITQSGGDHAARCKTIQQMLVDLGWSYTYVISDEQASRLYWGKFRDAASAEKHLARIRETRTPSGMAIFDQAAVVTFDPQTRPADATISTPTTQKQD